jgi:hypothetical protein
MFMSRLKNVRLGAKGFGNSCIDVRRVISMGFIRFLMRTRIISIGLELTT